MGSERWAVLVEFTRFSSLIALLAALSFAQKVKEARQIPCSKELVNANLELKTRHTFLASSRILLGQRFKIRRLS